MLAPGPTTPPAIQVLRWIRSPFRVMEQCHESRSSNTVIRVGTLDEPDRLPPDIHIYTTSKQPWVVLPPGARAVEQCYKSAEVWPKESLERRAALKL